MMGTYAKITVAGEDHVVPDHVLDALKKCDVDRSAILHAGSETPIPQISPDLSMHYRYIHAWITDALCDFKPADE